MQHKLHYNIQIDTIDRHIDRIWIAQGSDIVLNNIDVSILKFKLHNHALMLEKCHSINHCASQ